MKRKSMVLTTVLVLLSVCCSRLWARPTTAQQAHKAVTGWLRADPQPLGAALGGQVSRVETFTNEANEPLYYIVYLDPSGFVIVPADDLVEPIIGFSSEGTYDPSPKNPLGALVTQDVKGRLAAVRSSQGLQATAAAEAAIGAQAKWQQLESWADAVGALGLGHVCDVRRAPLVKSKWSQKTCCESPALACYNYYTPPYPEGDPGNYPCGCVATAMAQVMRYHEYAGEPAGPYEWDQMPFEPDCLTTEAQRQAIGALCYDAGISVAMAYGAEESKAKLSDVNVALVDTFQYDNAVYSGDRLSSTWNADLKHMINANLDACYPVILGLSDPNHAVVCDGYGYHNLVDPKPYHHLNIGWAGLYDAWYNLPPVDCNCGNVFEYITGCVYNIFASHSGEIVSGRVTDASGAPLKDATVTAEGPGGPYNMETDSNGIYAFKGIPSESWYTVSVTKAGYLFVTKTGPTGRSSGKAQTCGNVWGLDFDDRSVATSPSPADGAKDVDSNVVLSWNPRIGATSHDVYFGTDYDDVQTATTSDSAYQDNVELNQWDPSPDDELDWLTTYYWRIDEKDGPDTWKGMVWSFTAGDEIWDPDLILYYGLDQTQGVTVTDYSGYGHHGALVGLSGPAGWEGDGGRFGGCLRFTTQESLSVPSDTLENISSAITVSAWVNLEPGSSDEVVVFDAGDFGQEPTIKMTGLAPDSSGDVYWRAGQEPDDVLIWDGATPEAWGGDWHHLVFVKDEPADTMKIYFDAIEVESKTGVTETLSLVKNKPFVIGTYNTDPTSDHLSKFDDIRVYDRAIYPGDAAALFRGDALELAWGPSPIHGQPDVPPDANLAWRPGDYADEHDVYFGTNWDDVNDANTSMVNIYKARQIPCEYDPPGHLELETTYFWRIDEVNDSDGLLWKGNIWKFTVANFLVIDDFESYDNGSNRIDYTWDDTFVNWSGSLINLSQEPVYDGAQSMECEYDNAMDWGYGAYVSEVSRTFDDAWDWTNLGVKALAVYFHGQPGNDASVFDGLYVGVEDVTGPASYAEFRYGFYGPGESLIHLQEPEWREWNIKLQDFALAGVNLMAIKKIYVGLGNRTNTTTPGGLGTVWFDAFRLYRPRCKASFIKPAADLNNDCVVDWLDVDVLRQEWLKHDIDFSSPPEAPPVGNLVGQWELDGNADDSTGNNNDGTAEGTFAWVTGRIGSGAIQFSADGGRVLVPDAPELRPASQFTVAVWVNPARDQDGNPCLVVKGGKGWQTYAIELPELRPNLVFQDADGQGPFRIGCDRYLEQNEWAHLAGTYDGADAMIYLNGCYCKCQPATYPGLSLCQNPCDLAIGNCSEDTMDRPYIGQVDDVQIYNIALSQAQVVYLVSQGTGYIPLVSPANLYDLEPPGQKAVNLRDLAVLFDSWLEEELWP